VRDHLHYEEGKECRRKAAQDVFVERLKEMPLREQLTLITAGTHGSHYAERMTLEFIAKRVRSGAA
jgi:hypothetical protein